MKKYSYEELVQLKQEGKINWVDFVKAGDSREEYELWCGGERGQRPTLPRNDRKRNLRQSIIRSKHGHE